MFDITKCTEHHIFCNYAVPERLPKDCQQCQGLYAQYGDRDVKNILATDFPDVIVRTGTHPDFPLDKEG